MELRQYFLIIRRWLWLIVLCTLLGAVSAYLVSSRMTPVYSASTTLLVYQAPSSGSSEYSDILTSERLARTYSKMLKGQAVMEEVISKLGLKETAEELKERVSVELVRDTQLIRLKVEHTDPARAMQIGNAVADVFIAQIEALQQERYGDSMHSMRKQMDKLSSLIEETEAKLEDLDVPETAEEREEQSRLETILAGYRKTHATLLQNYEQMRVTAAQSADNVMVSEEAKVPRSPVRPRTMMNTALAAVVGAMLAVGAAFLIEYLDDTVKTPDDVGEATGLGTLGSIGRLAQEQELVTAAEPLSPISEAFRSLRTNIRFSGVDEPIKTLLVTSPGPTEGKSIMVANLGIAMAQAGLQVAVVDCDLRHPRQHRLFDLHSHGGLTGSLLDGSTDGRLQPAEVEGLTILPTGDLPPNPAELLGSQRMRELLDELAQEVDMVLIDTPPVLPVTDAAVLAQGVDGVLMVMDVGETRREAARQAVESLRQVGANVIGVVLNRVPSGGGRYYYYYYHYDGYYGDGKKKRKRRKARPNGPLAAVRRAFERVRGGPTD